MKHEHMISFRFAQIVTLCKLALAFIVSLFYRRKDIWLVSERGVDARDNGYWFFKFLRTEHPEIEAYYIISSNSPDRDRLTPYVPNVVNYRSFTHCLLLWRASILISTHAQGYFPFIGLGLWVKKHFPFYRRKCHINIKHGISKDHAAFLDYSNVGLDMIVAGVRQEYEFFLTAYGYPKDVVQLTGLCRFDGLKNASNRQILVMPTWREWLYKTSDFLQSEYVQKYVSLLNNEYLNHLLEKENLELVFYPHHEVQKYIEYFRQNCTGKHIIVADKNTYDVQLLLNQSALLITDYSSVYFDFAYMRKPVIYYHFDYKQYREEHYAEGWYDYKNGLGVVTQTEQECVKAIEDSIKEHFIMPKKYAQYAESMFPYRDNNNCERVYDAICRVKKTNELC